uniref:Uncharacterized protein n=1 Tax=Rhizophora mucronata TaxID=61149 RepID=A0A2P2N299_RHIMU
MLVTQISKSSKREEIVQSSQKI